ncbi:MAG: hypothetical protein R3F54_01505 [Alphaproteobacteria bacterium]
MYRPVIQLGDRDLERFDDLTVSLDREIDLEKAKQETERQKQTTERLKLRRRLTTLAIVMAFFGGASILGPDGLIVLKDLVVEVLKK